MNDVHSAVGSYVADALELSERAEFEAHLSYCDSLSLDAAHLMLRKLTRLQHLTATGVPAFRRKGIQRFSEPTPAVSCACLSH